jgi:hypothetical protein
MTWDEWKKSIDKLIEKEKIPGDWNLRYIDVQAYSPREIIEFGIIERNEKDKEFVIF